MKNKFASVVFSGVTLWCLAKAGTGLAQTDPIPNRLIDYPGFLKQAEVVGEVRERHRVSAERFMELARRAGSVVFDARSDAKFQELHVKGAKHLSFPDITAEELAKLFPSKETLILIYCNNNFLNEPSAFASKAPRASLNIHTFNTLFSYGYTNVYELGPLVELGQSPGNYDGKIPFEGTAVRR